LALGNVRNEGGNLRQTGLAGGGGGRCDHSGVWWNRGAGPGVAYIYKTSGGGRTFEAVEITRDKERPDQGGRGRALFSLEG